MKCVLTVQKSDYKKSLYDWQKSEEHNSQYSYTPKIMLPKPIVTVHGLAVCVCVNAYSGTAGHKAAPIAMASELRKPEKLNDCVQEICRENKRKIQYA